MGSFFLEADERLLDLMNDDRGFFPLHAIGNNGKQHIVMISKRYIKKVEELQASAKAAIAVLPGKYPEPSSSDDC